MTLTALAWAALILGVVGFAVWGVMVLAVALIRAFLEGRL